MKKLSKILLFFVAFAGLFFENNILGLRATRYRGKTYFGPGMHIEGINQKQIEEEVFSKEYGSAIFPEKNCQSLQDFFSVDQEILIALENAKRGVEDRTTLLQEFFTKNGNDAELLDFLNVLVANDILRPEYSFPLEKNYIKNTWVENKTIISTIYAFLKKGRLIFAEDTSEFDRNFFMLAIVPKILEISTKGPLKTDFAKYKITNPEKTSQLIREFQTSCWLNHENDYSVSLTPYLTLTQRLNIVHQLNEFGRYTLLLIEFDEFKRLYTRSYLGPNTLHEDAFINEAQEYRRNYPELWEKTVKPYLKQEIIELVSLRPDFDETQKKREIARLTGRTDRTWLEKISSYLP